MKKVMYLVMAALVMAGTVSCNKKANSDKPAPLDDSISAIYGKGTGMQLLMQDAQPASGMYGQSKKKLDKAQFMRGLKAGLAIDTTAADMAYMQGFEMGAQLAGGIPQMKEQQGINFNKDLFVQKLEMALNGKKAPSDKEMQELGKQLQQLLSKAQERFMKNAPKQQGQAVPQQAQKLTPEQEAQLKKAAEAAQKQADAKKAK